MAEVEVVLDASAVLALLHREPGADMVLRHIENAVVSAVNLAEVGAKLADYGMPEADIAEVVDAVGINVAPFDAAQAHVSASLRALTRARGLSLGDRACLALAKARGVPALTADRMWAGLDAGVEVRFIRGS